MGRADASAALRLSEVADRPLDPFYVRLGSRLKRARDARKLTQEQLATILGVSQGSISGYENGAITVDAKTLYQLSEILGITASVLLDQKCA